jgi:hypothetical protein
MKHTDERRQFPNYVFTLCKSAKKSVLYDTFQLQNHVIFLPFQKENYLWRWRQRGPPKHWYPTTTLHGVTTQKNSTFHAHRSENLKSHTIWRHNFIETIQIEWASEKREWERESNDRRKSMGKIISDECSGSLILLNISSTDKKLWEHCTLESQKWILYNFLCCLYLYAVQITSLKYSFLIALSNSVVAFVMEMWQHEQSRFQNSGPVTQSFTTVAWRF